MPGQTQTYNDKYVIVYNYKDVEPKVANREITQLCEDLESVGLQTELRAGRDQTLLIFVKAPRNVLGSYVYSSRLKDWLYGIIQTHPGGDKNSVVDGAFEAEDILSVYHLVNWPKSNGGAGVTPRWGQWENVESIFPLHNEQANLSLLRHLSSRLWLTNHDLDRIRNLFGTKVAFYYAFIQDYVVFLTFPAVTGLLAWRFLAAYSLTYAIVTTVWCTVFLEYWKIRQLDLSIRWDVQGVGVVKVTRPQYRWKKIIVDSTGRKEHYYPKWKHVLRQLLQVPFMAIATLVLGTVILGVFALETLISEAYNGPHKDVMEYIPTILLGIALPQITGYLELIATFIADLENHRTADTYDTSRTQKLFFLQSITNYLPILLTAFVYVPFGEQIVPLLESIATKVAGPYMSGYLGHGQAPQVDGDRLRTEIIALTVTGQISSFFEENLLPVLKRKLFEWCRHYRAKKAGHSDPLSIADDDPNEIGFLESARRQAALEPYNVQDDIAEIVLQFGFLALFSPAWPLIAAGFLVNNIIELRTDFFKLVHEHQRPAPVRTDGIGPWIASLDFLTWVGSVTTGAIVHLYGGGEWWTLPIAVFVSEHVFLALRGATRFLLGRVVGSEHIRRQRTERYLSRVRHLEEIEANQRANQLLAVTPAERQRKKSIRATSSDAFFAKQIEEAASAQFGIALMQAFREATSTRGGAEVAGRKRQQSKLD
ncbi:calcium-activated chloride channel-domain-containing protein [Corynascus similis CBS 632.67]